MDNAGFPDDSPSASTMAELLFPLIGGLGLFLIGMMLLSEGLIAFGGGVMKQALARFTGTPRMAFVSGTLATVIVQSSTATTVTLIGFVSAGLISFSQAIGVLIGIDGWLALGAALTWLATAVVTRYSSLAALIAAAAAPVISALMHGANNQTIVVGILGMALIGKHWQNIQRLMAGQESKIGSKKK